MALVLGAAVLALVGCDVARHRVRATPIPGALRGPALGLTEDNAALLMTPDEPSQPDAAAFDVARSELTALHPTYIRLLIDWAALQPVAAKPPDLEAAQTGCARMVAPCAPFGGVRAELEAIASQQRAAGGADDFQVVLDILGTPVWAAASSSGCEHVTDGTLSRPLSAVGLAGYRQLIHSLLALGEREGVALTWWSPWNEPNDPLFMSPQRSACTAESPAVAPAAYAQLVRAMDEELRSAGGDHHILLGELAAYETGSADRTSVSQFIAALPDDVLCNGSAWAIHAYAIRAMPAPAVDPVAALEAALDARGGCARGADVWVTEAGAGAPHPGRRRVAGASEEAAGCAALAEQLERWYSDPRVTAAFQYSFRDDPAFPVGLVSADLVRVYPVYRLWLEWSRRRVAGAAPPDAAQACT